MPGKKISYDLLNEMDVERSQKNEKQLIQKAHKRLIDAFNKMKMKWQEYRKFTVTAPELPKLYISRSKLTKRISLEDQY